MTRKVDGHIYPSKSLQIVGNLAVFGYTWSPILHEGKLFRENEENKSMHHSVERHQKRKFREIDSLVTSLVKPLLSRNFCQKSLRDNFRNFHTMFFVKVKVTIINSFIISIFNVFLMSL